MNDACSCGACFDDLWRETPLRIVVDLPTWERVLDKIENPSAPTPKMVDLFKTFEPK